MSQTNTNDQSDLNSLMGDELVETEQELVLEDESSDVVAEKEEENTQDKNSGDSVTISKAKLLSLKNALAIAQQSNQAVIDLLNTVAGDDTGRIGIGQISDDPVTTAKKLMEIDEEPGGKVVEGVFDGETMIGPDGKSYSVPANYASKSKLVEGDILKLTITDNGTFVYKQIGPIDRRRVIGALEKDDTNSFFVSSEGKKWKVLTASVTYFKGQESDEAVILVPKNGDSQWAAVDNVIRKA